MRENICFEILSIVWDKVWEVEREISAMKPTNR